MTGKIAYFGKNGKVGFEEHELPEVEPGAMLVRVLSSNICGSDVKNWKTGASLGVGGDKTCQGHEFVGRIERLGEGVTKDYAGESVKAGDRVKKGETLCLIEAMKMMSEVAAPCDCEILQILKSNGDLAAYGETLFRYRAC